MQKLMILVAATFFGTSVWAASYVVDTAHSEVGFNVRHLGISNVKGRFNKFEGTFNFDEAKNEISSVDVKIDAKSINTNDAKRDGHLMADDFFAADKNPQITFKSDKGAVKLVDKKAKIPGTLTIRGNSKPVTLDVTYGGSVKDPMGTEKVAFAATTTINRKDFGVNWNKTMDKGGVVVADEVTINIEGEGNKKK